MVLGLLRLAGSAGTQHVIQGVRVTPLRRISDERGRVMHMLRVDDPHFESFGEIYFSVVYPGAVKAWHLHRAMTLNYAVISGSVKLVLYDERPSSPTVGETVELFPGEADYSLVTVPPGIWNGFKGIGITPAIVANCATLPHDPEEIVRRSHDDREIGYDWDIKHG